MKYMPWVHDVMKSLPNALVAWIQTALAAFHAEQQVSRAQVERIKSSPTHQWSSTDHPTVFHAILISKILPEEKTAERLSEDAQVVVMAGTLTTASTLELITFWLLSRPDILMKLKSELQSAIPSIHDISTISIAAVEALPYLRAVVKEGLRLSYGLSTRSQRIDPDNPILYVNPRTGQEFIIPPKVPVSINSVQVHRTEAIFPHSRDFAPERWLGEEGRKLEKYLTSFSRGSRNCVGMNLAYGEMYLTLAHIWRVWGSRDATLADDVGVLELWETGLDDVEMHADHFIPTPRKGSQGVRVKARGK
jgi:cytochrome P450